MPGDGIGKRYGLGDVDAGHGPNLLWNCDGLSISSLATSVLRCLAAMLLKYRYTR